MQDNFRFPGSRPSSPPSAIPHLPTPGARIQRRPHQADRPRDRIGPAKEPPARTAVSQPVSRRPRLGRGRTWAQTRGCGRPVWILLAGLLGGELMLSGQTNQPPTVEILSTALRPGTTYIDVDFRVVDPDDETVEVGALGWLNNGTRLEHVIPIRALVEGTHTNRGVNVPANRPLRLTWNIAADSDLTVASVQVEIRAKDRRSLLPLHWVTVPADGAYPATTYLRRPISEAEVISILLWELALGNPELTIQRNYCVLSNFCVISDGGDPPFVIQSTGPRLVAAGGLPSYCVLAQDLVTSTDAYIGANPAALAYVYDRLGLRVARPEESRPDLSRYGIASSYVRVSGDDPVDRAYVAGGPHAWKDKFALWSPRGWFFLHTLFLRGTRALSLGPAWSIALTRDGLVPLNTTSTPAEATNVTGIAAGATHALALRADGSVLAWDTYHLDGAPNQYGQLEVPPQAMPAMAIAAGAYHNLVVRSNGTVVAWGRNDRGQCQVPPTATNVIAVSAGEQHSVALRADGTVVAWGDNSKGQLQVPPTATNIVAIAAGLHHTLALRADGTVVAWGDNARGQTNVPAEATNVVAVSAGPIHSVALRADGRAVAWGASPEPAGVVGFFSGIDLLGYGCAADYMVFVDKKTP